MRRARHVEAPRSGGGRLIVFGLLVGLLAGLVAYAVGPAARDVFVTRYIVPVSDLPAPLQGLRVMQVSDLHLPRNPEAAQTAARLVADAKPDVLLLTGDILDDESPPALAALDAFLGTARSTRGTFAVAGERELDFSASLESAYERHKVRLLTGDRATINVDGASLVINGFAGSPGALRELKPVAFVPGRPGDVDDLAKRRVEIWMVHAPQLVGAIPRDDLKNIAFIVAGHTLGGPLGIPPLISPSRYRSGWYTVDRTHLFVSNGVGTGRLPARLLAPAEVAVFTLRRAVQPYAVPQRE